MATNVTTEHKIELTSAEIANIWTCYLNDSMAVCTIGFNLIHVEDTEIHSVLDYAYKLSQVHVLKLKSFFIEEDFTVPIGFAFETDVNANAPRLFTDHFYLFYIQNIGKIGLASCAMNLANSARLATTTFSDKLNIFHIITLNTAGIGHVRLTAEIVTFMEDGANLMNDNGWMEKPPHAMDRDQLSNGKT